jgi:hypothetical protein
VALDLVVPDLLPPADAPEAMRSVRLPTLEKWLARADLKHVPVRGATSWLASAFGLDTPVPVAAITLAADAEPDTGLWLRADPVHLRIDRDALALHDATILDVTAEEAAALVAALQALFRPDGLEFRAPTPSRWYVRVPEGERPTTTPLEEAMGRDVFGLLPRGTGRFNWRSAITEAQMVLADSAANRQREADGRPTINSVWFWGEGKLPGKVERVYDAVEASDPFAAGLAKLSSARLSPPRISPSPSRRGPDSGGPNSLVVIDTLVAPLRNGDAGRWLETARALEAEWFSTLGETIKRHGTVRLILPAAQDTVVATLSPRAQWRWFRARKPLVAHA